MKYTNKLLTIAAMLCLLLAVGCKKKDPGPTPPEEIPGEALVGTWKAVQNNAVTGPVADQFTDFSINITATASRVGYTTTNNGDKIVFPSSGTFDVEASDNIKSSAGAEIIRQPDGVPVNAMVSSDGNVLTLKFNIDTSTAGVQPDNGRVAGIDGDYTFILDKQ